MSRTKKRLLVITIVGLISVLIVLVIMFFVRQKGWDFHENTSKELRDYQNYWVSTGKLAKCEEGYLVQREMGQYTVLCIWDGKSDTYEPICTKANCKHDNGKCSAYFSSDETMIQYSNGYIFYSLKKLEPNGKVRFDIYRADMDGTNRQSMLVVANESMTFESSSFFVHNDHIISCEFYEGDNYTISTKLVDYNMKLQDEEGFKTVICESEDWNLDVADISGNRILYTNEVDDKEQVYEYDMTTKESRLVITEDIGFVRYVGNSIVYTSNEGNILLKGGDANNVVVLGIGKLEQLAYDGKYLYIDNVPMYKMTEEERLEEHTVSIYDKEGELVNVIAMPSAESKIPRMCFFGDKDKIFATNFTGDEIYVMDKSELEKGEWKLIQWE